MARRLLGSLLGSLLAGGLVLTGSPAYAVDGSVSYVEPTDDGLQILVDVPPNAAIDFDSVAVTIDGTSAPAEAAPADSTTSVRRTAVLVMDTSNSMRGDRIEAAQAAARIFLESVPDDVYVGIVTFDNDVSSALAPSLDREQALAVVDDLSLSAQTRLYDGIQAGLELTGSEGLRQLLVLSDGTDTSETPLEDTTAAIGVSETLVNVVSLEQRGRAERALEAIATAGAGTVISADADALGQAFSAEADVLARQVLVTAEIPEGVTAAEGTVSVTLGSDQGDVTASAFTSIGASTAAPGAPAIAADDPLTLDSTWLYAGLGALGGGLLVTLLLLAPRPQRQLVGEELATQYTRRVTRVGADGESEASDQALAQATETAEKVLRANKSLESRISDRLEGAGNPFKPAEWLLLHVGIFLVSGLVGMLLGGGSLILGLVFLALGAFGPWMYLGFRRNRRRKAFEKLLPDTLQLISGSLAAGLSLAQSIDTVVRDGQDPVASEFKRVLVETRLGITLDDALDGVAERFQSKDFSWVVMAIRIQRQVGGNLAELLDTVAGTIREREYMRRQVAALAAEGKLSAWVLGGLPPAFLVYLLFSKRDYVMPMFTEPLGWMMLGGAAMLLGVGVFWMSRLVKVEV
ncbi:type II secretion system F family protein [Nocardioides coralli]|uniref:type II secretion system F family protein n=1 Tax=Nocardioides coralli TaxID=2872154 RepID=UPI001CA3EE3B|nr:type II secretion system F family protein [Nocardioides coralli]QZY28013.1 type II secretion system F family protein [Nocardioides coralli]